MFSFYDKKEIPEYVAKTIEEMTELLRNWNNIPYDPAEGRRIREAFVKSKYPE